MNSLNRSGKFRGRSGRFSATEPAPTARPIPARGEAPRTNATNTRGLKARPIQISIPQILLVAVHPILLQERTILRLKILLRMMRFLSVDVSNQRIQIGRPNRERAITTLLRKLRRLALQPFGRGRLDLRNQVRNIRLAIQSNRKMHMVGNAPNTQTFALVISHNSRKIRKQIGPHTFVQERNAVLRTEHNMHKKEAPRSCHGEDYRSDLRPSTFAGNRSWGFAPRWYSVALPALLPLLLPSLLLSLFVIPEGNLLLLLLLPLGTPRLQPWVS